MEGLTVALCTYVILMLNHTLYSNWTQGSALFQEELISVNLNPLIRAIPIGALDTACHNRHKIHILPGYVLFCT